MSNQDYQQVWRTTLAQIEVKLDSPAQYKTFFHGAKLLDIKGGKALISVSNPYKSDWLRQKHHDLIKTTITHVYGKDLDIDIVVDTSEASAIPKITRAEANASKLQTSAPPSLLSMKNGMSQTLTDIIGRSGLNQKYTLGSFVIGDSNRIAHAAVIAVIDNPGKVYNPLFIYGKTGVGKTHLAQAVGRAILERNPNLGIVYTPSEGFLNDMVHAIRTNKTEAFRNKYRAVDVLIIDDIQLISKWVRTQDEFFNTFNEIIQNDKHIVLIADRRPEDIQDLEARLRSRFQGGMVVEIAEPDYELRLAILEKKANATGCEISNKILEVIAQNVNGNIRELEGALQAVALFNQMKKDGDLSENEVKKIIGVDSKSKREKVKVPGVIRKVGATFGVSVKDIKGPRRTKDMATARQVCMYILREEFSYKLEDIAKFLNRQDHTTVMHAVDKTKSLMMKDDGFKDQVVSVIRDLYEGVDSD